MILNIDKFRGCLLGGAAGDALGYVVEFRSAEDIFKIYGEEGIREYELFHGKAYISDDTQMTLFTANGLLRGYTRMCLRGIMGPWESYVEFAYKDWLMTQNQSYGQNSNHNQSWLLNHKEFYNNRAPGNTCISALLLDKCGRIDYSINNSKGCGGVMRVAPAGLYLPKHMNSIEDVDKIGAEIAAITHSHPLGYIPAATLTHIIARCVTSDEELIDIVKEAVSTTVKLFSEKKYIREYEDIMKKAIDLSTSEIDDLDAIRQLGEGWVAEEALAIAVYCALKYHDDFEKGIIASVNHDGDSDSTGAVTGNILGTYLGVNAIPEKYISPLELKEVIEEIARDLYEDCKMSECGDCYDEKWMDKYVTGSYYVG